MMLVNIVYEQVIFAPQLTYINHQSCSCELNLGFTLFELLYTYG